MPTGSFKDRGASVMLSLLRAQGVAAVLEDSSGNGGAAVAAYAAAGGMRAKILVPAEHLPGQDRAVPAPPAPTIELVPGSRQDCADAALRQAARDSSTPATTGTPSSCRAPRRWPMSCGRISASGAGQRHRALRRRVQRAGLRHRLLRAAAARQIERLPRIFAAQPANCAPIARAFLDLAPAEPRPTIAEGTAIAQPIRLRECLGVLQQSRGGAVMLSEAEIGAAALDLARTGIYVEPTCAQAAAAFGKLLAAGTIRPEERPWWC